MRGVSRGRLTQRNANRHWLGPKQAARDFCNNFYREDGPTQNLRPQNGPSDIFLVSILSLL